MTTTEPLGLTPGQLAQLRAELSPRRLWPRLVAAVVALVLVTAATAAGYAAGHAQPRVAVRTRTIVKVDRPTPRTITRWRTRTVTQTAPATTPCVEQDGTVVPAVGAAVAGAPGLTACTMTVEPATPASAGDLLVLTAPDGTSASFPLGPTP